MLTRLITTCRLRTTSITRRDLSSLQSKSDEAYLDEEISAIENFFTKHSPKSPEAKNGHRPKSSLKKYLIQESPIDHGHVVNKHELISESVGFQRALAHSDLITAKMHKLASAVANNGPKIVLDFRFISDKVESTPYLYPQVAQILAHNGEQAHAPFQIHFCNYSKASEFHRVYSESLNFEENFVLETDQNYTEVFARKSLVYLSPDSRYEMRSFDPSRVYIIGGICSNPLFRGRFEHATIERAQKEGLRCERLPLRKNVWKGSADLSIDRVFKILSNLYDGDDWQESLRKNRMNF